jgi:peptidoglycan hydrolase CwlO-like protein
MGNNDQDWENKVKGLIEQIKELKIYLNVNNSVFEENISLKEKIKLLEGEIQGLKEVIDVLLEQR